MSFFKASCKKLAFDFLMIGLFSLPNLPFHLAVRWLLGQFKDPVFHGSMHYLGGFIFLFFVVGARHSCLYQRYKSFVGYLLLFHFIE